MFRTLPIMLCLAIIVALTSGMPFAAAPTREQAAHPAPMTVPLEYWQSGTPLTLSSGRSVTVTPPRIYSLFTVFETGDDGKLVVDKEGNIKEQSAEFVFIALVAFDFSTVSSDELRTMAIEIMGRHLASRVKEMDLEAEGRSVSGIVRFAVEASQRPDSQSVLIESYADIKFVRDAGDNWLVADN